MAQGEDILEPLGIRSSQTPKGTAGAWGQLVGHCFLRLSGSPEYARISGVFLGLQGKKEISKQ